MASDKRMGAELFYGEEICRAKAVELFDEIGLPRGLLPLTDLQESGYVRETGYVWLRQKGPSEHYNPNLKRSVSYAPEITGYVEKQRMKKMSGVSVKEFMMWVNITEMSLDASKNTIFFKSSFGIGKSFPVSYFLPQQAEGQEGGQPTNRIQ